MLFGEEYVPDIGESTELRKEKYIVNASELVQMVLNKADSDTEDIDFPVCSTDVITQSDMCAKNDGLPIQLPTTAQSNPSSCFENVSVNWADEMDDIMMSPSTDPAVPNAEEDHDMTVETGETSPNEEVSDQSDDIEDDVDRDDSSMSDKEGIPVKGTATTSDEMLLGQPIRIWRLGTLKEECTTRGLIKRGKKADLIERLREWESLNNEQ
jgi:hypothetical protein